MRILFLGNNRVGLEVLKHLKRLDENVIAIVIHPAETRTFGQQIMEAAGLPRDRVFSGDRIREPGVLEKIRNLRPDIGISALFGHILKPDFLAIFPNGVINLHPSYLPYNRGQYPNVWSIIEGTPAGATLHFIDPGIDTGDIIAQRTVAVEPIDTGQTLYRKLESTCLDLFREYWPVVRDGNPPRHPQSIDEGTFHRTRDADLIDRIDLDRQTTARDLINLLRARTFPPHQGAYFIENGRRIGIRITLEYEDDEP